MEILLKAFALIKNSEFVNYWLFVKCILLNNRKYIFVRNAQIHEIYKFTNQIHINLNCKKPIINLTHIKHSLRFYKCYDFFLIDGGKI